MFLLWTSTKHVLSLKRLCGHVRSAIYWIILFQLEDAEVIYIRDQVAAKVMLRHIVHHSLRQLLAGPPAACFTVINEVLLYNQDRCEETCFSGHNFTFWAFKETSIPSLQ